MRATVCPHDSARALPTWIEFFVVLGTVSGREFGFKPAADFPEFYRLWPQVDLVYANPLDALRLADTFGFIPLAASDRYDEVVLLVREDTPAHLAAFAGARVGFVPGQFASLLGMELLKKAGHAPGELVPFASWGEVLSALQAGKIRHALLYKDFYESLEPVSREGTKPVLISETRRFAHSFLLAPSRAEEAKALKGALLRMHEHPMAKLVLKDLGIGRFLPVDLAPLRALVRS